MRYIAESLNNNNKKNNKKTSFLNLPYVNYNFSAKDYMNNFISSL